MAELNLNQNTKVTDILNTYPWLKDELIKMSDQFKILDNPLAKMFLSNATLSDVAKKANLDLDAVLAQLKQMIAAHQG